MAEIIGEATLVLNLEIVPGPRVFVHSGVAPDLVRAFYEVPDSIVDRLRPDDDPSTFVEALERLLDGAS